MEIKINSRLLKSALESANKAIDNKPSIPALANFLFRGDGNYLTIIGSNAATTIVESIPSTAEGVAVIPTNLLDLVRVLPDEEITLTADIAACKVRWASGESSLPCFNPADYPEISRTEGGVHFSLASDVLASALNHAVPFTSDDELRPIMAGVLFNGRDGKLDVVASDSHTLGLVTVPCESEEPISFVCPASVLNIVRNAKCDTVDIIANNESCELRFGTTTVIARTIIGKFPAYRSVIPTSFSSSLNAKKSVLLDSIKRVLICASKATGCIKLSLGVLGCDISAEDTGFNTAAREVPSEVLYDGADLVIGFKGDYLVRAISAIECENITIKFNGSNKAAILTSEGDPCTMLVMPIKIQ